MRFGYIAAIVAGLCLLPRIGFGLEPRDIFKAGDPSIVVIFVADKANKDLALGSGVIVAPRDVVTSCHVLENAARITVKQGNVQRSAKLRFQDAARDLCQIHLDDSFPAGKPVSGYVMSRDLEVGQQVYALSAPQGLEHTLTRGIVSALRAMKDNAGHLIQTDAAISQGSSGGGLFDSEARLVGIITFQFREGQNLNFAIPAEWIQQLEERTRDRTANGSAEGTAGGQQGAPDSRWYPKTGDRWVYRLLDRKRSMGAVSIEIVETGNGTVRERITKEGSPGFVVEREVSAVFPTRSFQPLVVLPGGYQLIELAAYFPPGSELTSETQLGRIPGEVTIPQAGKRRVLWQTKVIGTERVRIPAGEFQAWKVQAETKVKIHHGDIRLVCNLWYSPSVQRPLKVSLNSIWPITTQSTEEALELIEFGAAK
jgi:hypothetical protein